MRVRGRATARTVRRSDAVMGVGWDASGDVAAGDVMMIRLDKMSDEGRIRRKARSLAPGRRYRRSTTARLQARIRAGA